MSATSKFFLQAMGLALALAVVLCAGPLLDGPDDIATAQAVADDLRDAQHSAQASAKAVQP